MRLSSLEDVEDTVADIPVIDVLALIDLQLPDEKDRQREQYNLIEYLQDELEEKQAQQLPAWQHTHEDDGKEQQGVGSLSGNGAQDKSSGKLTATCLRLHLAQYAGVDETAGEEGDTGGDEDARSEGEDGMEPLLVLVIRSTGNHVHVYWHLSYQHRLQDVPTADSSLSGFLYMFCYQL